jgi:hypothetical protein
MSDVAEEHVHSERADNPFFQACRSRVNLRRAAKAALVVGPILALINQTPLLWRLLHGEMPPSNAVRRISLTFAVPFVVSLYSSSEGRCPASAISPARRTMRFQPGLSARTAHSTEEADE